MKDITMDNYNDNMQWFQLELAKHNWHERWRSRAARLLYWAGRQLDPDPRLARVEVEVSENDTAYTWKHGHKGV